MVIGAVNLLLDDPFDPAALQTDALAMPFGLNGGGHRRRNKPRLMDRHLAAVVLIDHQHAVGLEPGRLRLGKGKHIIREQPLGSQDPK